VYEYLRLYYVSKKRNAPLLLHGGTLAWRGELDGAKEYAFVGQALVCVGQLLSWAKPTHDPH
jgi:hypothetical protein